MLKVFRQFITVSFPNTGVQRIQPLFTMNRASRTRLSSSSNVKTIGTHDGKFHCDEVLAIAMLKLLPEYTDAQVIRTRDAETLKVCDVVVDVGGEYDAATLRFDHHQRSFEHTMKTLLPGKPWETRLSSAGLVYVHYGLAVIAQVLNKKKEDEVVGKLYDKIYENFIEEIDAVDNGISVSDDKLRYRITTTISQRVSRLNSSWRDPKPDETQGFNKALQLVGAEFVERIHHYATDWWEAYSIVFASVDARYDVDRSGEIIELENGAVPWKEHLADIEAETSVKINFVIFPDQKGMWRVQAVPITPDSFILRVPLLKEWQGLRDKELQEISQIPTANFVHANGFIGGAAERHAVIRMARSSISTDENE